MCSFNSIAGVMFLALSACATLDGKPRIATSPLACVRGAVAEATPTAEAGDKRAHCLGGARVAERCSPFEAALASYVKELKDLFGRGDAQVTDIRAGHAGIRCASANPGSSDAAPCCESQGY
jgi:hypothetical protein